MQKLDLSKETISSIIEFYLLPSSLNDTAKKFNFSKNVIKRILLENNISLHDKETLDILHAKNSSERTERAKWRLLTNEQVAQIIKFYLVPNTIAETAREFNLGRKDISNILDLNNIKKHDSSVCIKLQQQAMVNTNLEKYGVAYQMQLEQNKEKRKLTCIEKYGFDNAAKTDEVKEKIKHTKFIKYGDENFSNKEQAAQTKLIKYNDPYFTNREKCGQTCLLKYGTKSYLQTDEFKLKRKQTMLEDYGYENNSQSSEWKEKVSDRYLKELGVPWNSQCEAWKDSVAETWKNKSQEEINDINSKCQLTKLALYGDKNYNNRQKAIETNIEKYGVDSYSKTIEFAKKRVSKYKYEGIYFDSSWELAIYIYAIDNNLEIKRLPVCLKYFCNDIEYSYFPDFYFKGKLIEVKGDQFISDDDELINPFTENSEEQFKQYCKLQCMITNNVEIWSWDICKFYLDYINKKYGKKFLMQYRIY